MSATTKKRNPRREFNKLFNAGFFPWGGLGLDGSKAPYGNAWQRFGERVPADNEIDDFLDMRPAHVGIILPFRELKSGKTVRITVLDCECEEVGEEVLELIWKICPELVKKIVVRKNTRSGGVHVFVQHPRNTRLSTVRLYDPRIKLKKPGHDNPDKAPLVFETLGTTNGAKYCIVYADGRKYRSKRHLEDLLTMTAAEMQQLEQVLEQLAELHPAPSKKSEKKTSRKNSGKNWNSADTTTDEFDSDLDVPEMLEEEGWSFDHEDDDRWYYARPGKRSGVSASVLKENHLLHVFTSSTDFEKDETYTPFQVYALLRHGAKKGGNYKKAIRTLKKQRYKEATASIPKKQSLTLPSKAVTITQCAETAFQLFGENKELFFRGGKVQEIVQGGTTDQLEIMRAERFCSVLERHFRTKKWQGLADCPTLEDSPCSKNTAELILATDAARELLPEITILSSFPVLAPDGRVVQQGYDPETKCYVLNDLDVDVPDVRTAVKRLSGLLRDYNFKSDADYSRAIAALLTPALTFGGFLKRTPLTLLEADQSQTGKGYFVRAVATIYGEEAQLIAQRKGGVGSFDESLAGKLAAGKPFISIDNLRGRLDSQYLEALLTAEGLFGVRLPYKGEIQIDSRQFCLFGTSNAVELTPDTANRMSIIRILKQSKGYRFKEWKAGDLVEHIAAKRSYLLGSVFAVLQAWIDEGKPRTNEARHDFREWAQSLDWIVQNIFEEAPLMDGFVEAKERITNGSLSFIRQLGVLIEKQEKLRSPFSASELYSLCEEHGIDVPNCRGDDEQAGRLQIGRIFMQNFLGTDRLTVDDYLIIRRKEDMQRENGKGIRPTNFYEFYKESETMRKS